MSGGKEARPKVLITGVAGFVGGNLAKRLLRDAGLEVVGIDNLAQGTMANVPHGVRFSHLDIRLKRIFPLFEGVDAVFHLAAKSSVFDCHRNPAEAHEVNANGTANVLEAARQAGVRKFVYADTSAEYEGISELPSKVDCVAPRSVYATSKRAGALFCQDYAKRFGMVVTTLRYFNVYGPAQDWRRVVPPVMSAFILKLLRGERPVIYGDGSKRRDFIFVDDVNDFHLLTLRDPRTDGGTYNLGSGVSHSVREIFDLVASQLQIETAPIHEPDLPGEAERTLADLSESLALGWAPQVRIEDGIARTVEYLRGVAEGLEPRGRAPAAAHTKPQTA